MKTLGKGPEAPSHASMFRLQKGMNNEIQICSRLLLLDRPVCPFHRPGTKNGMKEIGGMMPVVINQRIRLLHETSSGDVTGQTSLPPCVEYSKPVRLNQRHTSPTLFIDSELPFHLLHVFPYFPMDVRCQKSTAGDSRRYFPSSPYKQ